MITASTEDGAAGSAGSRDAPGIVVMSGQPRAVRGLLVGDRAPAAQEVEVHALVGLQDVVEEHAEISAGHAVRPRPPRGLSPGDLLVRYPQGQPTLRHVEPDLVTVLHQRLDRK